MKIAICDDCTKDRDRLVHLCKLTGVGENYEYLTYSSGDDLLAAFAGGESFDLIFLDVDMPGIDGISTGKLLREQNMNVIIIFVTSHPEFALDAFECEAFHYLLKPCDSERLNEVLSRAQTRLGLLRQYHVVKAKDRTVKLPVSELYYIECLNRHIVYHMKNEDVTTRETLSDVYDALAPLGFCQIHQGYIVNMGKISSIDKDTVTLDDGRHVMMSIRRKSEVFLEYSRYVEKYTR